MFGEYLYYKLYLIAKNTPSNTIKGYEYDIKQFYNYINIPIEKITEKDINKYIEYLKKEKKYSNGTINRKTFAIKSFFTYLQEIKIININPTIHIKLQRTKEKEPNILDINDIFKIISLAETLRDKLIFEILFSTGIKREELIKIKKQDIDFKKGYLIVKTKYQERYIPLPPKVLNHLEEYINENDSQSKWLFKGKDDKHLSATRVNEIFNYYSEKYNIKNFTPNAIRHSFAYYMLKNGADIKTIQDILGHKSIVSTTIYTKLLSNKGIKDSIKYNPLFRK